MYGIHPVEELLAMRPESIERVFLASDRKSPPLFAILKACRKKKIQAQHVPPAKLQQMAGSGKHQGVVAITSPKEFIAIDDLRSRLALLDHAPLLLLPASIEDPHNLGAIIRSAAAFAVDAILLERRNTVLLSDTVSKASAGTLEHCTIARPRNLESIVADFAGQEYLIAGASGENGHSPQQCNYTGPTLLIVGGEHRGIPPYLSKLCTARLSIPMTAHVQSLNVSAATAILLYEISRQRQFAFK